MATTGLPPGTAREVRMLVDGHAKYTALLADIAQARDSIDVEYYIFLADRTGTSVRDALIERARAGVRVRLLVDAVGSSKTPRKFFAPLVEAGGLVAWFHPMRFGRVWQRPWLNLRTHRKIVVIDGHIAYTGGINVTDEEDETLRPDAYRDLHLRLEGRIARALQVLFVEDWAYATEHPPVLPPAPEETEPGSYSVQAIASGPDSDWEAIHRIYVSAIHSAQRRVWLTTPYFVPGEAALMALTSAALSGLDVRLLVPKNGDSLIVTLAARSYFDQLLAAGVRVYEYGPRMLHSKALLVDDHLVSIGSANFDYRSFRLNFEVSLLFHDARLAGELERVIEGDLGHSPRVREDRPRPLWTVRPPRGFCAVALAPALRVCVVHFGQTIRTAGVDDALVVARVGGRGLRGRIAHHGRRGSWRCACCSRCCSAWAGSSGLYSARAGAARATRWRWSIRSSCAACASRHRRASSPRSNSSVRASRRLMAPRTRDEAAREATVLSVNVNKIAVLRNSRGGTEPDVVQAAKHVPGCRRARDHRAPSARCAACCAEDVMRCRC